MAEAKIEQRGAGAAVADAEVMRGLLAGYDVRCAGCGYNLRGLSPGLCPECRAPIELRVSGGGTPRALVWLMWIAVAACVFHGYSGARTAFREVSAANVPAWSNPGAAVYVFWTAYMYVRAMVGVLGLAWVALDVWAWFPTRGLPEGEAALWRIVKLAVGVLVLMRVSQVVFWVIAWWI